MNEAWLKLAKSPDIGATSRLHFKRIAARAMRSFLSKLHVAATPISAAAEWR